MDQDLLAPGSLIADKWHVDRVLGRGGMGTVVAATHVEHGRRVAIKVLHASFIDQPEVVARFLREARSCVRLHSDHVCHVLDIGTVDGRLPYIEMELLDGHDLGQLIDQRALPVEVATDYVLQACVAIAEAHSLGIVHRDLKPSNLFVTRGLDGTPLVKVLDFGIATAPAGETKLTQTATVLGSPSYMSPEQLRSARDADARSDIWSLGVILYEAVTQRVPFAGETITDVAVRVITDAPAPLDDIDPRFAAIVMRCLDKNPDRRYQNVSDLATDLAVIGGDRAQQSAALISHVASAQSAIASLPLHVEPRRRTTLGSAAGYVATHAPLPRRRTGLVAALGAVALAMIGGTVLAARGFERVHADRGAASSVATIDHVQAAGRGQRQPSAPPPSTPAATPSAPPEQARSDRPPTHDAKPRDARVAQQPTTQPAAIHDPDPIDDVAPDLAAMRDALAHEQWLAAATSAKRVLKMMPDNTEAGKGLSKAECHMHAPRFVRRTIGVFSKTVRTCGS